MSRQSGSLVVRATVRVFGRRQSHRGRHTTGQPDIDGIENVDYLTSTEALEFQYAFSGTFSRGNGGHQHPH